jgi:hypothetical protein
MDPQTMALIQAMIAGKSSDFSSATMDPVMSFLMGTYQPKPTFDENQLWERYAPNTLMAASGNPDDPYTAAASRIRAGEAPWNLYDEVPKKVKPGVWTKFLDSIAAEQQTVKSKLMEQSLEQDPFEKQGLPRADAKYTLDDMYKYSPKTFDKIMEGFDEADKWEKGKLAEIQARYGPKMVTDPKEKLAMLMKIQEENSARQFLKEKDDSVWDSIKSGTGKTVRFLNPFVSLSGQKKDRAQKALEQMGGTPILDEGASKMREDYANFLASMVARKPQSASNKVSQAEKVGAVIQKELEARGGSPLKDALIQAATLKAALKRGI